MEFKTCDGTELDKNTKAPHQIERSEGLPLSFTINVRL